MYVLRLFSRIFKLSALSRGIKSELYGDFNCLNCFHSFRTQNKLQSHKIVWENKDFRGIIMPFEYTKILEFNQIKNLIKHHLLFMQNLNV